MSQQQPAERAEISIGSRVGAFIVLGALATFCLIAAGDEHGIERYGLGLAAVPFLVGVVAQISALLGRRKHPAE